MSEGENFDIRPSDENTGEVRVPDVVSESVPPPLPALHYAPYGTRFAAFFTDGVLEAVLQAALSVALGALAAAFLRGAGWGASEGFMSLTAGSIANAYGLLWWGCGAFNRIVIQWYFGGTVGKLIFGLRVAELGGGELRFWTNLKRYLLGWTSALPMGLGYLAPLWTARKQAFHDILARTIVLERQ